MNAILNIDFSKISKAELLEYCSVLHSSGNEWQKNITDFVQEWFNTNDQIALKTSGTTGKSKNIEVEKSRMKVSASMTGEYFQLHKGSKVLLALSPNFIAGKMMLVRAIELQWNLYAVEPSGNPLKDLKMDFDFTALVPNQLYEILQSNERNELKKIQKVLIGGGSISPALLKEIRDFPNQFYQSYGMTETVSHVAIKQLYPNEQLTYHALKNVSFQCDERNCLIINAPHLSPSPIVTNDIVKLISETEMEWLGRYDNIINSGGIKINPEEVERKIQHLIDTPFIVSSINDEKLQNKLILLVEGNTNIHLETINQHLSKFEKIKEVRLNCSFERTNSGKIKRPN